MNGRIAIGGAFLLKRKDMEREFSVEPFFFCYFSLRNGSMTHAALDSVFDG